MGTARRLYLYVVSLVSLIALTGGAGSLLQLLVGRLGDALVGNPVMGGDISSGQAALSVAMIAVGGPVWALHWWLVRRGMRADAQDGAEDRASAVRAWYLALVMALALSAAVGGVVGVVAIALRILLDAATGETVALPLAVALVATPTWAAHARMRAAEIRTTPLRGAAAWAGRLYRYLATYALLVVAVGNAAWLLETLLSVAVGRRDFGVDETWWRGAAAGQVAAVLGAGAALVVHWREAAGTIRDRERVGEDERGTRLRAAFFGAAILTTVAWTAMGVAGALADAGRLLTGMTSGGPETWLELVVGPPVALLPVAAAAWWLLTTLRREATASGTLRVLAADRLATHLLALVGLALVAVGIGQLLGTGIERLAGDAQGEPVLYGRDANLGVPWYVAQVLVGLVLWLPAWGAVLEARRREPALERTAAASRAYLFLVAGTALVTAVPATISILYRLLEPLLGGGSPTLVRDIAFPIAALVVAAVGGGYHGRILLGDLAMRAAPVTAPAVAAPAGPASTVSGTQAAPSAGLVEAGGDGHGAIPAHGATVELVLEVPDGEDAPAVVEGLRAHLPPGAQLRLRPLG